MPILTFKMPNGTLVKGSTERWVSSILVALTPAQRAKVFELVAGKLQQVPTPGQHILHAEGLNLGITQR